MHIKVIIFIVFPEADVLTQNMYGQDLGHNAGLFDKTKGTAAPAHTAVQCLCVSTLPPMW